MVNKRVSSCSELVTMREESSTVQSLKDEFTQRIADAERKAQLACKERDIAKKVMLSRIVCEFSSRLISESKNAQLKSCCFFFLFFRTTGDKRFTRGALYQTKLG